MSIAAHVLRPSPEPKGALRASGMDLPIRGQGVVSLAARSRTPAADARSRAIATVARLQHGPLLRYLTRRCGSFDEAQDILQEAYVRMLTVEHIETIHALDRYLWRCALNIMKDHGRARRVHDRIERALLIQDELLSPSAEAAADAQQRLRLVGEAVDQLPPRCLEAFCLRIARGLTFDEVGRDMKISPRMAKVYVARTLELLQRRLDRTETDRHSIFRATAPASSRAAARPALGHLMCGPAASGCAAPPSPHGISLDGQRDETELNTDTARHPETDRTDPNSPSSGDMLMKNSDAASVIRALIEGHEPGSENLLPADSVVHRAEVLRALLAAAAALERAEARVQRRAQLPVNVGAPWSDAEETQAVEAFKAGQSPEEIAQKHGRTLRAVEARLQRLGLITAEERMTVGGFPNVA